MSTRRKEDFENVAPPLSVKELTEVLVKQHGLKDGKYNLGIEFQIGVGAVGPNQAETLPGIVVGVKSVGLALSNEENSTTVDAAALKGTAALPAARKARARTPKPSLTSKETA